MHYLERNVERLKHLLKGPNLTEKKSTSDLLLSKFNKGDGEAYEYVFKSFFNKLCYFANNLINNETASQDIVQEVFVKLWQRDNCFETYDQLSAFAYVSVRNSCFNYLKQKRNQTTDVNSIDGYQFTDPDQIVLDHMISAEVISVVSRAVDTLPEECAKIMKLVLRGYSMVEISIMLNLASSSVRAQKARALKLLKLKIPQNMFILLFP